MAAGPPGVRVLGVGDLKRVHQRLAYYEAGEIAHIENVMATESRSRDHRRLNRFEEIVSSEFEREEENSRDLESTERFELKNETQKTIESDTSFEAGLEVSGGFGPVTVSAFANFSTSSSSQQTALNATEYAKDVMERSVNRLKERVLTYRRRTTLEETEETNHHGFDNPDTEHITGIYRWVDKYYRAKVFNYGKRLFYEFVVPEPSSFFQFAKIRNAAQSGESAKPDKPMRLTTRFPLEPTDTPLAPSDISRINYMELIRRHGAQGIEPPPPDKVVIEKSIAREIRPIGGGLAISEDVALPEGYVASAGHLAYSLIISTTTPRINSLIVGNRYINFVGSDFILDPVRGALSFTIMSVGFALKHGSIQVECELAPEVFAAWQLKTYDAIMTAYNKALLDYQERQAAASIQQGVAIRGQNPEVNRKIIETELKYGCLRLWADSDLDLPAGIQQPAAGQPYPTIRRTDAVNNALPITFFEKAFEWHNMSYEFLPYFWGRQETWPEALATEDNDPHFQAFLRAGAARVVVPVRTELAKSVLYYQLGGPIQLHNLPDFSTSMNPDVVIANSYLEELNATEEPNIGNGLVDIDKDDPDSFLVKVPTSLVWLQDGSSALPVFE